MIVRIAPTLSKLKASCVCTVHVYSDHIKGKNLSTPSSVHVNSEHCDEIVIALN